MKGSERKAVDPSLCRLFRDYEDPLGGEKAAYCELVGLKTSCRGNIPYCERTDTIRDFVLNQMERRTGD